MRQRTDLLSDLFVVVRQGDAADPAQAVDRYVVDDPEVLAQLGRLIARRFGVAGPVVRTLRGPSEKP
jgi:hypothetical protein